MSLVLQVVPRSSPSEALAQSAALLASTLAECAGVSWRTIFAADDRAGLSGELARTRPGDTVLLHYVGYGYARRGAPVWLGRLLEAWRRGDSGRRLLVSFHEIAASGPPWRSSFWMAPLQRRVAARLARVATGAVTSLERYAEFLHRLAPGLRVDVLPVFSPIGEPSRVVPWVERERSLVLFGAPGARREIWARHVSGIERVLDTLEIERVVEIGDDVSGPATCSGRPVERTGVLASDQVGEILGRSRVGYLAYPLEYLGKSSVFAAVCAHGLLPVCGGRRERGATAPGEAERWLAAESVGGCDADEMARIADNARRWYADHDLAHHVATLRRILGR